MKSLILINLIVLSSSFAVQSEEENVKSVVLTAYVGGIHNGGPIDDIRKGFHPSFNMIRLNNNEVSPLSIEDRIKNIEKSRSSGNPNSTKTEAKFIHVDVVGHSANVELELFKGGNKIFTDHLLLYKFEEGWRIVSKTFYRHPQ